jgi:hypothetical protein
VINSSTARPTTSRNCATVAASLIHAPATLPRPVSATMPPPVPAPWQPVNAALLLAAVAMNTPAVAQPAVAAETGAWHWRARRNPAAT